SDPGGDLVWFAFLRAFAGRFRCWIFFEGTPRDAGFLGRGDRTASRFGRFQILDHRVPLVQRDWLRRGDRAGARIQRATSTRRGGLIKTSTPLDEAPTTRFETAKLSRWIAQREPGFCPTLYA